MSASNSTGTVKAVFDLAIEIEYIAADLYREFVTLFSDIQSVADFWQDLAADEINHGNSLKQIRDSLTENQKNSPCAPELFEQVSKMNRLVHRVDIDSIRCLDDAYRISHELEFSEVNAIFKLLSTKFVTFEDREQFVVTEIRQHQQKLLDFDRKFGNRQWRKAIYPNAV